MCVRISLAHPAGKGEEAWGGLCGDPGIHHFIIDPSRKTELMVRTSDKQNVKMVFFPGNSEKYPSFGGKRGKVFSSSSSSSSA